MKKPNDLIMSTFIFVALCTVTALAQPQMRIHQGFISVNNAAYNVGPGVTSFQVHEKYTFEIFLDNSQSQDYVIDRCYMNDILFIKEYGCVQCSSYVLQSIETESYNVPGATKRTLVHFMAPSQQVTIRCEIRTLNCCGCAERSCERRPILGIGYAVAPLKLVCGSTLIGTGALAPYAVGGAGLGGAYVGRDIGAVWPWWLWLLIGLLLLLLLLCCIALCLLAFSRRRKDKTTVTRLATAAEMKGVSVAAACVGTEGITHEEKCVETTGSISNPNHEMTRITPAIAVIKEDEYHEEIRGERRNEERLREDRETYGRNDTIGNYRRRHDEYEEYEDRQRHERPLPRGDNSGCYNVREARVTNERFARNNGGNTLPPSYNGTAVRDRSSYRNFAYERDMGRVAPLSGFDEVETTERRYCLSDDECDVVEKDIKRTHTTRFLQETRQINANDGSEAGSERFREEGVQHAVYAQSLHV